MTCEEARNLWHDQCDGLITPVQQAALAGHLQTCATCQTYSRQMSAILGGLETLRAETEDITATADGASQRASAPTTRTHTTHWRRWGSLAAAIVLMICTRWYLLDQRPMPSHLSTENSTTKPGVVKTGESATPVSYASVTFAGNSTTAFLPVEQETSQPNVHLFRLFPIVHSGNDQVNGS